MIISLPKKDFSEAIHLVARFAERKSATLPTLAGIALIAGDDGIKLRATNLEVGIDLTISGSITEEGVVVLPAAVIRDIAGSLFGEGSVTIEYAGDTAVITSEQEKYDKTLPAEDFPVIPLPENAEKFSIQGNLLKTLIGSVVSCASTSTVRPDLSSVLVASSGGTIKAVASDSFRLAEKKMPISGGVHPFSVLIPAKNALECIQTVPDEEIAIALDEHQCSFSWKTGVLSTRLVTANYPDYEQIIPKTFAAEAALLKKDLEAALRRTAIFSDSFQKVRISLEKETSRVVLSARNPDVGESSDALPAAITGANVELSFNHRYLSAPLSFIEAQTITLSSGGIGRPLIMRGQGDASFTYLVMPMNQ